MDKYAPFEGDGRIKIPPPSNTRTDTRPMAITRSAAREAINRFIRLGVAVHSNAAATLWVEEAWCQTQGIQYVVTRQYLDGELAGWVVRLLEKRY